MTRSIKRGYPYPAHGRAVIRPACQRFKSRAWRRLTGQLLDFADALSAFAHAIGPSVRA